MAMHFSPLHPSLWVDTCPETHYPPLDGALQVDVAVLGGGIVGLTAAYLLKKGGLRVAVLEADRVGHGVTGYSTAKVTALHGTRYQQILREHGQEKAVLYAEANSAALETLAAIVAEEGIDCHLERVPAYTYAEDEAQRGQVQEECQVLKAVNLPAEFVEDLELPFPTRGAVRLPGQIGFHPCRYLQGLAKAVHGRGSHVFENTRARQVSTDAPYVVSTDRGTVTARRVIVATHLPILDRGLFFARASPMASYGLAAPVSPGQAVDGMYVSAGSPTRSVRTALVDGQAMLVLVGYGHRVGEGDPEQHAAQLEAWGRQAFDLQEVRYRWSTQDSFSMDHLPFVGSVGQEAILTATGFGGWGLSNGVAAAQLLADTILERPNLSAKLYDPNRLTLSGVATALKENVKAAVHFVGDRLTEAAPEEVPPGEGRVYLRGGQHVAAYRDAGGTLHERSAVCTHQGCIVGWNDADKTWDCPCHGSRFDRAGQVIHGPAVADLRRLPDPAP